MEDTYNIKAIVLNRKSHGESDSRVAVYSLESGKMELVARGAKKIKSKLAGHLEPLNLVDIMVARGQRHDYAATAVSEKCHCQIKNDLAKLAAAGRAVKIVERLTRPGMVDGQIFGLLKDYLAELEKTKKDGWLETAFFMLKLLAKLGHKPELSFCLNCAGKIQPGGNRFDLARGGLICGRCARAGDGNQLAIADDGIKLLRLALKCDFKQLAKVKVSKKLGEEAGAVIEKFYRYHF